MSRYVNVLDTGLAHDEAQAVATQYLEGEGFTYKDERGEMVWRKGMGALANPQFMKVEIADDGTVTLEAWTAGVSLVPGVYGGELDPMQGVIGAGPKLALRARVEELERRLGGTPAASGQPGQVPPGWHPDPTGRHEYRYWDGTEWTATVSDGGRSSTDPEGAS